MPLVRNKSEEVDTLSNYKTSVLEKKSWNSAPVYLSWLVRGYHLSIFNREPLPCLTAPTFSRIRPAKRSVSPTCTSWSLECPRWFRSSAAPSRRFPRPSANGIPTFSSPANLQNRNTFPVSVIIYNTPPGIADGIYLWIYSRPRTLQRDEHDAGHQPEHRRHAHLLPYEIRRHDYLQGADPQKVQVKHGVIEPVHVVRQQIHHLSERGLAQGRFAQPQRLQL